jgi:hypothetical protein
MLSPSTTAALLTIRPARSEDDRALRDLAALDSARPLAGEALVAESGGAAIAALELRTGRGIADPFVPSAEAVEVLRVRAGQLDGHREQRTHRRVHRLAAIAGLLR